MTNRAPHTLPPSTQHTPHNLLQPSHTGWKHAGDGIPAHIEKAVCNQDDREPVHSSHTRRPTHRQSQGLAQGRAGPIPLPISESYVLERGGPAGRKRASQPIIRQRQGSAA